MYEDFLINMPQNKIFRNKTSKKIKRIKVEEPEHKRKCQSFDVNDELLEEKINILNNNVALSESFSGISFSIEDLKNRDLKNKRNHISFNIRKNTFNSEGTIGEPGIEIKKICSSNVVNSPKKLEYFRKQFLKENKNDDIKESKNLETKAKRPNYLIKSCFYNNNDVKFGRSLSKKECSPMLDFYGYKDKTDTSGYVIKKYYKHSTFGKANNNNNNNEILLKKNVIENNIDYDNLKFEPNNLLSNSNHHYQNQNDFLNDNEESFIKIIQADSSDDENKEIHSIFEDNNNAYFGNEIDKINKLKDKEDTLSNLVNLSFKSQVVEKRHSLNESMNNNKHNNSINFIGQNLISEGLSNSIYSNRSLNDEFVFKNHSKIFKTNFTGSQSNNNSMNKFQEDKVNNENNLNKSGKHNLLSYLRNNINSQKYNDSEEEFENKQYNNINNEINISKENINEQNCEKQNINLNKELNQINLIKNNINQNKIKCINQNEINNDNFNQFFPKVNNNNINNNNNSNYLQNINYFNYNPQNNNNNNMPNPYINNTINFIYNNNMNLFYNNPYNINNNEINIPNINNNFLIKNNNMNYNFYYPQQFGTTNFPNQINQMINNSILNNINNNINNNMNNNINNNINNINNNYFQQNGIISFNNNHLNQKTEHKQPQKYMENKTNEKLKNFNKMSNEELAKHAHILAKSQEGCRYLEQIIDSNPNIVSNLFFPNILGYFEELSNNKYGNFYIKKIIKYLSKELLGKLIEFLYPMITRIGTNQYGSKILEQLIKRIKDNDDLLLSFIKDIIPNIILFINDLNGTHIIYKLLLLKSKYIRLIEEQICNNIKSIYITREGSSLLKKYFDIIKKECNNTKNYDKLIYFINIINNNLSLIITDQFGNYIIRHIILNINHSINSMIVQNIINNLVFYSNQKYSSNVVENCLDNNYIKDYIINELTKQYIFNSIFLNEYGNYVIQKALSFADEEKKTILFQYIIQVSNQLQTLPFGPKLLSKLLINYPKLSIYILNIYK